MKVSVTFKTPNAVDLGIVDAIEANCGPLNDYEFDELKDDLHKKIQKWVRYSELITVEFDTGAGTATVKKVT